MFFMFQKSKSRIFKFLNWTMFQKNDIPFPLKVTKVNESTKGDMDLKMFINMEMII